MPDKGLKYSPCKIILYKRMGSLSLLKERFGGELIVDVKYPDIRIFQQIIDATSKIMDEANLYFTPEGMKVKGFDPAKTSYIEIYIPSTTFLEYNIGDENARVGFNMARLSNILKRGMRGDPLVMKATYDRVLIEIESIVDKRYAFPNIEVAEPETGEPVFTHDTEATLIADPLKKILKDIETFSNIVELDSETGETPRLSFRAFLEDPTMGKMESVLRSDSPAIISLTVKNNSNAKYDIGFLKPVLNLTRISDTVEVKFSTDKPLELVFKTADETRVRYIMTPFIL